MNPLIILFLTFIAQMLIAAVQRPEDSGLLTLDKLLIGSNDLSSEGAMQVPKISFNAVRIVELARYNISSDEKPEYILTYVNVTEARRLVNRSASINSSLSKDVQHMADCEMTSGYKIYPKGKDINAKRSGYFTWGLWAKHIYNVAYNYSAPFSAIAHIVGKVIAWLNGEAFVRNASWWMLIQGTVKFADGVTSIVTNILLRKKGRTKPCGAIQWSVTDSYGKFWLVVGSTWSRNGDGTCATSILKSHAMTAMQEAIDEHEGLVGACVRIIIEGNFLGNCGFQLTDMSWGPWSIPCPEP